MLWAITGHVLMWSGVCVFMVASLKVTSGPTLFAAGHWTHKRQLVWRCDGVLCWCSDMVMMVSSRDSSIVVVVVVMMV